MDKIEQVAKGLGWELWGGRYILSVSRDDMTRQDGTLTPAGQIAVQERLLGMGCDVTLKRRNLGVSVFDGDEQREFPTLIDALIWAESQTPERGE